MIKNVREMIGPRQAGILLMGLGLVTFGMIGLCGSGVSSHSLLIVILLIEVAFAGILFGSMIN
ncbi:hypothetical protein C2R22_21345 (plasmid) [Salinigranum rubrum]|uniref:Uncharacterized protein n=1 Tax=Salinigranum rubrum TaxID=755307 RepID=A0A2I8VSE9_9EURY|nr:hypothetical protein C2R22_21345 [Salinigranum rubrum]